MSWNTFGGTDAEWDDLVTSLNATSPFSRSGWSRYKEGGRWSTIRCVFSTDRGTTSAAQILSFSFLNVITVAWIPGGICGALEIDAERLIRFVSNTTGSKAVYCRVSFHQATDNESPSTLTTLKWKKAASFLGAEETFVVSKTGGSLADKSNLTSNWARNLNRGLKHNFLTSIWDHPDPSEIHDLFTEMVAYKKSHGPAEIPSLESLRKLLGSMNNELIFVQTRDNSGKLIAIRAAFIVGRFAWDALAAANEEARKCYASYVCAWNLLEELNERGVKHYDLAGIDPLENEGVFNFKKGFGGKRVNYLGEWEAARPSIARHLAGALISRMG